MAERRRSTHRNSKSFIDRAGAKEAAKKEAHAEVISDKAMERALVVIRLAMGTGDKAA